MKRGTLYGVGVGPGDPELLTLKAVRILSEADVIAIPETGKSEKAALKIAQQYVNGKRLLECSMPMGWDKELIGKKYDEAAENICALLDEGKKVAFITLGDPTVYSTYIYIHKRVVARGYSAEIISGVPSFCAAAALLGDSLCEGGEALMIVPAAYPNVDECLDFTGNKVFMKSGSKISFLKGKLAEKNYSNVNMVSNCGMENESVCRGMEAIDEQAGYFSLIVVKE